MENTKMHQSTQHIICTKLFYVDFLAKKNNLCWTSKNAELFVGLYQLRFSSNDYHSVNAQKDKS